MAFDGIDGLDDLHDTTVATQTESEGTQQNNEEVTNEGGENIEIEIENRESTNPDVPIDQNLPPESTETVTSSLSGIEQYLSQFDIDGGMIDFKDGTKEHFNNLAPEKQVEVLTKLHTFSTKDIEEKYGLNEDEINLINYTRQQEGTIDEIIDRLAQQRAQTYIAAQTLGTVKAEEMSSDEIYTAFLLKSNPDATAEQIEADLQTAKKMSNYDKIVTNLKSNMIEEQKQAAIQQEEANKAEMFQEIENQRKEVVGVVSKMTDVDGLSINDGIKNDVLDLILNVDEDGDSTFMTQVFSDPKELFRAAFWYKNGPDILKSREDYWKKEKSEAYKRGQVDAKNGKVSFSASDVPDDKTKTTRFLGETGETVSWDDIQQI